VINKNQLKDQAFYDRTLSASTSYNDYCLSPNCYERWMAPVTHKLATVCNAALIAVTRKLKIVACHALLLALTELCLFALGG